MKITVKCLETSKKGMFIQGKEYEGVIWGNTHYRLIGEDRKPHLMSIKRFIEIYKKNIR